MLRIVLRRVALSIALILFVSLVTFVLQSMIPGDPARAILGLNGTPERYEQLREQLHLNDPVLVQYARYMRGLLQGDLGRSLISQEPVAQSLANRLPVSLSLLVLATALCAIVGITLGVLSARSTRSGFVDSLSLVGQALPNFWIALVLVSLFAVTIPIFPAIGYVPLTDSLNGWATSLALPVVALSIGGVAVVAKTTRDGVATALEQPYVRSLRAAGVGERSILLRHALKNSGVGIITVVGIAFVGALAGSVFVENVFALPGLGSLVITATSQHDIPVIQGVALAFTVIVIVVNLVVDVSYAWLNPKVRVS